MSSVMTDPLVLASLVAASLGTVLLAQARVQARLLRRRIASGSSAVVVDPATGLFAAGAAWQCIRAEASRATRLGRPLDVWLGSGVDADALDAQGRELVYTMPAGAMGVRLDERRLCVVSCADGDSTPADSARELTWSHRRVAPGEDAATAVLAFVSEASVA